MSSGTRIGIFGQSGSGKSAKMDEMIKDKPDLICFDRLITRKPFATWARLKHITRLDQLINHVTSNYGKGCRVWYQPEMGREEEDFSDLCKFLIQFQGHIFNQGVDPRHICLAADEVSNILPVHGLPKKLNGGSLICKEGRHYNINLIGATQRPAQVSTEFRGNLDIRYILRLSEPNDLDAIIDMTGIKELGAAVRDMPKFMGVRVDQANPDQAKRLMSFQTKKLF